MMNLRFVGAGLPRTGTHSVQIALEHLLDGRCYHMREIPGHPFDLGEGGERALAGDSSALDQVLDGYVATVDWPASLFWRELSEANKLNPPCWRVCLCCVKGQARRTRTSVELKRP
jgi:hypothetical protein